MPLESVNQRKCNSTITLLCKLNYNTLSALEIDQQRNEERDYCYKMYLINNTNNHNHTHTHTHSSRIALKTGIDEKAQSMTIRGKQRPPLASQSIAKAFWVIQAHTYIQTQGYTH